MIQTNHAISIDQGKFIFDLCLKHYGNKIDRIKTLTTPMRSDSQFERELFKAVPLTPEELKEHVLTYKGSYRYHTGKFQYDITYTCFDLSFSIQCLAKYNNAPTSVAFEAIGHHYCYLAGDVICP